MKPYSLILAFAFAGSVCVVPTVRAAGFEKSVLWSGHYGALAGAATSVVDDAQSLYFNPAGLARLEGIQFDGNLSPTFSKFSGPIVTNNVSVSGKNSFSPIFGGFIGYPLARGVALGLGSYVAGGTRAKFQSVSYAARQTFYDSLFPTIETDVKIIEYSMGLGFEPVDGLRFGLGWRLTQVDARFSSAATVPVASAPLVSLNFTKLHDTKYNGFRLGAQFEPTGSDWAFGLSFRSTLAFTAKGNIGGDVESAIANSTAMTGSVGTAEISGVFPMQLNFGSAVRLGRFNRAMLEWSFTRYALNRSLDVNGQVLAPAGTIAGSAVTVNASDIETHWTNQHNLRLGFERSVSDDLRLRGGYALTSQVTNRSFARASIASPGMGHTFVAGIGKTLMSGEKRELEVDFALEYSLASGNGTYIESSTTSITGSFSSRAFVVAHTGVSYRF